MCRRAPNEKVTAFRRRVYAPEGEVLRSQLAACAAKIVDAMAGARPEMPPGIEDRNADVWEPLFAVADAAGGDWPSRARAAAVALVGAAQDAEPSFGIRLLADMKTVFEAAGKSALATAIILEELIDLPESPWGDLKGKPINERGLARRLQQYGIKSKVVRIGERTPRGYSSADFHDAWLRYCARSDAAEAQQAQQAQPAAKTATSRAKMLQVRKRSQAQQRRSQERRRCRKCCEQGACATDERNAEDSSTKPRDVEDVADVALTRGDRAGDDDLGIPDSLLRPPADASCDYCDGCHGETLEAEWVNGRLEVVAPALPIVRPGESGATFLGAPPKRRPQRIRAAHNQASEG